MVLIDATLIQQERGDGKIRLPMYRLMYRYGAAVSGFGWTSPEAAMVKKLSGDKHLRRSAVF